MMLNPLISHKDIHIPEHTKKFAFSKIHIDVPSSSTGIYKALISGMQETIPGLWNPK